MQGIVISPRFELYSNVINFGNTSIDPEDLRRYVTYWDNIDFPDNDKVSLESENEEFDFLIAAKAMQRTKYKLSTFPKNIGETHKSLLYKTLMQNNKKRNQIWTLAQAQTNLVLNKEDMVETRAANIALYNTLPVPNANVPLEDILKFKIKRSAELQAFRVVMGEFYQEIIRSHDTEYAIETKVTQIEHSLQELTRVMDESKLKRVQRSLNAKIDIGKATSAFGGMVAGSVANYYPMSVGIVGGITAATFAGIRISVDLSLKPKETPADLRPYAYLYEVEKINQMR